MSGTLIVRCPYCAAHFNAEVGASFERGEIVPSPIQRKGEPPK